MHTAPAPIRRRSTAGPAIPAASPTPHLPPPLAGVVTLPTSALSTTTSTTTTEPSVTPPAPCQVPVAPSGASVLPLHPSVAHAVDAAAAAQHPAFAGTTGPRGVTTLPAAGRASADGADAWSRLDEEDGSVLTEYGLLIVVAATVAGVLIQWAGGSQITGLFNALLRAARDTVGA